MKLLTCLCVMLLAACNHYPYDVVDTKPREVVYVFPATAESVGLTQAEAQDIDRMLDSIPANSVRLAEIVPGRYDESARLEALQYHLIHRGFASDMVRVYGSASQPAMTLRVRYRPFPETARCSEWQSEGAFNAENAMFLRNGCSNANNLKAMVARPSDLLVPQSDPRAMTETAVRAIGVYNGTVEPIETQSTDDRYTSRTTDDD